MQSTENIMHNYYVFVNLHFIILYYVFIINLYYVSVKLLEFDELKKIEKIKFTVHNLYRLFLLSRGNYNSCHEQRNSILTAQRRLENSIKRTTDISDGFLLSINRRYKADSERLSPIFTKQKIRRI